MTTASEMYTGIFDLYRKGNLQEAEAGCRMLLDAHPDNVETRFLMGQILQDTSRLMEAESAYRETLKHQPDHPDANCNLGGLLHTAGRFNEAITCYEKALSATPGNYRLEYNLAHACMELQQYAQAEEYLRKVVASKPDFFDAYYNLGIVLARQGNRGEALQCYRQTVQLKPDHTNAYNNMGTLFMAQGDYQDSIKAYEKALANAPDHPKIHFNMGSCLKASGQYIQAVNSFKEALRLDPELSKAYVEICQCNQIICEWRSNIYTTEKLSDITKTCIEKQTANPIYPFDSLSLPLAPDIQRKIATAHANTISKNAEAYNQPGKHFSYNTSSRLRIGYVSQKFNNHAGAHLIASLFGIHDRKRFEVFGYSIGDDDGSIYRQRIEQGCEHFVDISNCTFPDAARRIYEDGINILVDLGVYNTFSRTEIFALRPAPIQVSYLGYPGTSGADFYDYILTDKVVTPPDQQQWYSETFAYLPHCYQVNDHLLKIPGEIPSRAECGLPDNGFVFCSFNNSYKIEPDIFDIWMRILLRVPDSVLWLLDHSPETSSNLRREATQRGVAGERIIFAEKQPKDRHLARHQHAGLFLDTLYYNAHTTASDSLRMGIPVVTLPGATFASRVASSLLEAVMLPEMIATNKEEYIEISVNVSTNSEFYDRIINLLTTNIKTAPLFDTPQFARDIEGIYDEMWSIHTANKKTRFIGIDT